MKTNLTILALFVALISCTKPNQQPVNQTKQLTVWLAGNGYISDFTVNGSIVTSPATVKIGDKAFINLVTRDIRSTISYKVSLDGAILYQATNSKDIKINLTIK